MSSFEFSGQLLRRSGLAIGLVAVACVEAAKPEDPLGVAQFVASGTPESRDYAPSAPVGAAAARTGAGPMNPSAPAAVGGSAGQSSALPTSQSSAGTPAVMRPGPSATGSGVANGSAGASATSTAGAPAPINGAAGAPATAGTPAAAGTLTIDFKSVTQRGNYAPRNVGAVWIETGSGMFVKTLERWAGIRANHLTAWNAASGGWGSIFGGGNTADMMDAVSRATLRSHEMHHVMWNMKDAMGKVVADGMYEVVVECTENNFGSGANASVMFVKGPTPQMITAPDKPPFSGFSLNYQP